MTTLSDALAGRYTIEREVGAGGMATVYLARDIRHDRDVAIKVLHPELGAAIGGERFLAEIKTTAKLQHPHILPLLDSGQADGFLYYVMPYVAGETLRARLDREGQLPVEDAICVAREVADAVGTAHELGIIHRDIKPENILLQGGHALVADFGIALAVQQAGGARMTQTGLSLGTPQYMSPEQAMGERQIDLRTDIYALGAVVYEMLVGDPPFTGSSVRAIIAKAMTERPTPPRTVRDTVPVGVEAAVLKALAKLLADRFTSASAFSDALANGVSSGVISAPAASAEPPRDGRSNRVWQVIVSAVVIAVVAALVPRSQGSVPSVVMQRQLTYEGTVVGAAISPDGLWIAWVQDDCAIVDLPNCTTTLQVREVDGVQSVRIATWHYISPDLHWSGDGKSVVFVGSESGATDRVFVVDRLGGRPRQIPVSPSAITILRDGHTIAAAVDGPSAHWLKRYDLNTLSIVDSVQLPPHLVLSSMSASPADGTIAGTGVFAGGSRTLALIGPEAQLLDTMFIPSRDVVRWDSAGTALLVFDDGESGSPGDDLLRVGVNRHKFDRGAEPHVLLGLVAGALGEFDASHTGRFAIVSATTGQDILVGAYGAPPSSWRSLRSGSMTAWGIAAFSADGRTVTNGASDNIAENLYAFPLDGSRPRALTSYHGKAKTGGTWAQDADYSPDGTHVVYTRGSAKSVDVVFTDSGGGRDRKVMTALWAQGFAGPRWMTDDIIVTRRSRAFVAVDTSGVVRDSVVIPDSVGYTEGTWMNRAERSMYFSTASKAIAAADFRTHTVRIAAKAPFALNVVGWLPSGAMLVTDATLQGTGMSYKALKTSVFRVEPDGKLTLVSTVARHCLYVTIDRAGTTLACTRTTIGGDVLLAAVNPGVR